MIVELGGVVHVQPLGDAAHRPVQVQLEVRQPVALGQHDAADQQRHGRRVGALHADEEAHAAAGGQVDGQRQPRPADVAPGETVDDEDVGLGVVDLDDLQWAGGAEAAGGDLRVRIIGQAGKLGVMVSLDSTGYGIARRRKQALLAAAAADLHVSAQHRMCEFALPRQPPLDHLADHVLHRRQQTLRLIQPTTGIRYQGRGDRVAQEAAAQPVHGCPVHAQQLCGAPCLHTLHRASAKRSEDPRNLDLPLGDRAGCRQGRIPCRGTSEI